MSESIQKLIAEAYAAGCERGHDSTVEGRYHFDPDEAGQEWAEENMSRLEASLKGEPVAMEKCWACCGHGKQYTHAGQQHNCTVCSGTGQQAVRPQPAVSGEGESALMQVLHDPENQPSQYGTVPLSMLSKFGVPAPKYPDDGNGSDDAYNRGWNDCRISLFAALPQPTPQQAGWQSMRTAPKDKPCIVTNGVAVGEANWFEDDNGWWWAQTHPTDAHDGMVYQPTHWQPLPPPPTEQKS